MLKQKFYATHLLVIAAMGLPAAFANDEAATDAPAAASEEAATAPSPWPSPTPTDVPCKKNGTIPGNWTAPGKDDPTFPVTPPVSWDQFKEACLHPENFHNQVPPTNIKLQCSELRTEYI